VDNPSTSQTVVVEVTVWRSVSNPDALYLSTRVEGGGWRTEDTALDMSERSRSGSFHQSNAIRLEVALEGGATAGVEVTVWRSVANPAAIYVSTRADEGSWRTENTALDMSALSRSRNFHQSNAVRVEVEVGNLIPEFPAPGTLTRIPSLNATVVDLRLYERPIESSHPDERIYTTTFEQLTTRAIAWELKLVHPPRSSPVEYDIETSIYRSDGSVLAQFTTDGLIEPGWTNSRHGHGWGYAAPANWQPGTYHTVLWVEGEIIAGRSFEIIDRQIPETRAFAALRDGLEWAEGPLSHDSQVALLALAGLLDADPELAETVAALSWVRQGPRGEGLWTMQQLVALAREDVPLARRVAAFPWLADGVTAEEWLGLRDLALLAGAGDTATRLAAGLQWTGDSIDASERRGLSYLRTIAGQDQWLEQIAAYPWVVDDLTDAEQGLLWNLDRLAVGDSHLGNLLLKFPWMQDDITENERWLFWNLRELAVVYPDLADLVLAFPWVQDDVTVDERWTVRYLRELAVVYPDLADLVLAFPWVQDNITADERWAVRHLQELTVANPDLAGMLATYPWVQDDITVEERWTVRNVRELAVASPDFAGMVATYPWIQDDITSRERWTVRDLSDFAAEHLQFAETVGEFAWLQDGLTREEAGTVRHLRELAGAGAGSIVGMPFLQALSPAGAAATNALRNLALWAPEALPAILEHPAISDGITEDEAPIVSTLWGVQRTNPDLIETLLDPAQVMREERIIELPYSGEVTLTIIRTAKGQARTMDLVEDAVRSVEELMQAPLPRGQVTYLFEEAITTTFFGTHFGTHIALSPKVDSGGFSKAQAFRPIVHEAAHYYWAGNIAWINEGVANLLETVVDGSFEDLPERDRVFPCPYARRISDLEDAGPQQRSLEFRCSYSLGFRLFRDLYRELGEDFWDGLRLLYQKSQVDDDSDDCSGTRLRACHVEAAFKAGATDEAITAVDKVFDFWYEKRDPPPATPE